MPGRLAPSRRECKYLVSQDRVPLLRRWIQPFVDPDPYARDLPGHRYLVDTLYLDSPGLELYSSTARGLRNRFKLRLRRYGTDPSLPVHAEIKRRSDDAVLKVRAAIPAATAREFLSGRLPAAVHGPVFEEFRQAAAVLGAGPVVHVRYRREAWQSRGPDPVRITFDTALQAARARSGREPADADWRAIPVAGAVLELKFSGGLPAWLGRLIQEHELQRQSVPKYLLAVDRVGRPGLARAAAGT